MVGVVRKRDRADGQGVDDGFAGKRLLHRRREMFQQEWDIRINDVVSDEDVCEGQLLDQVPDFLGCTVACLRVFRVRRVDGPPGTDEVFALSVPLYVERTQSFHPTLL